jgi:rubredoxin
MYRAGPSARFAADPPGDAAFHPRESLESLPMSTVATSLWICVSCGWIYDPAEGDPDGGIPAGTPFEEIPEDWFCPVCGARKTDFEPYEG